MNKIILSLFIFLLLVSVSFAECRKPFYDPPGDNHKNTMFYIEKDTNKNVVFYDTNLTNNDKLNRKKPVDVYWQMFDNDGEREELSFFEKKLAYEIVNVREVLEGKKYKIRIISVKRDIFITYEKGCGIAETTINGKLARLEKISLSVQNTSFLPKLLYLDIYGQDLENGQEVIERYYHN